MRGKGSDAQEYWENARKSRFRAFRRQHALFTGEASHDARRIISRFKVLVEVLPLDDKVIDLALASELKDFEDAIQFA